MAILEVQNISKRYGGAEVLSNVSFSLEEGKVLAVIGPSGSGKTTLLRCLNFLEKPDTGKITVRGEILFDSDDNTRYNERIIRQKRLHFGLVFQSFNLFPQYTALENVTLARIIAAKRLPE
jgi:polar amino acid transport system ATP-binding protein